jgi:hypothetical protein
MAITASELRANIYCLLDDVLETEQPLEIERKGRTLVVSPKQAAPRLERLTPHDDYIAGDPGDLVSIDWSGEWRP